MASKLTLHYESCRPYAEQDSDELDDEIIARSNPETGQVESLEILFFSRRLLDGGVCELPVTADLYPAK